ncbi:SDR family NAD(P)-dependent oxidoreductase [Aliidiomarina haloalkalitolerans]|uniref:Dihydromonapterin reductase n=1 Tax=Aliidiomarina haloalkalitolerans TaxID=859059 RepID=A0A432VXH8_9GAMM|nr:SDR family NAD(P)-dependent oxidoreductase [Aliidiomarina haloalkalitolerans]RUO21382.1 short-chain dehydrogenase [Aliidiomarina haloalkalitolerans]
MTKPIALITGAGRRLGLHMTRSLLNQGWHVVALTRSRIGELAALAETDVALDVVTCNALNDESVEQTISLIKQRYDHLDFILHNASIYEKDSKHASHLGQFYDDLYKVHMKFPALLNYGLKSLLTNSVRPTANVIHVTDIYAANPNAEYALYCSTKAGLENLMLSFAKQLAPHVRVNAIQPGPIKFLPEHSSAEQQQVLSETLLPVEGGFEALQKAIESILDNEYMTAAVIRVDGGRSVT